MISKSNLILAAAPTEVMAARAYGLTLAHMAYRGEGGAHGLRADLRGSARGEHLLVGDAGFDGRGHPGPFCQEVLRECAARGYTGVVCDFDRHFPVLARAVEELSPLLARRGWPLYVSEPYGPHSETAKVLIPTALSGGTLRGRLEEAAARYGAGRVALAVERSAADFYLPAPNGHGQPLSQAELKALLDEREPAVFFSNELCAHYFTYMSRQTGAHFVLFDDAASIRKKLYLARSLDISDAILPYPAVADLLEDILA